ncbi:hypothetical protein EB796_011065 [Bugula neritina]|uniref:Chitin-binding type-2 domain-containing protein n=1 Tax=Bugula neritina TaxID=10212 RepID=A0A7J7JZ94_BUGNE|nr:hypothetical protein EB796_011065 [Bugula neritina]
MFRLNLLCATVAVVLVAMVITRAEGQTDPNYDCEEKGNFYTIVKGTNCRKFLHGTASLPAKELSCSEGLAFDKIHCVCNRIEAFNCDDLNVVG